MSNTIYSAILPVISQDKNKFNYVYQITEISTGMKYIGSRGSKKLTAIKDLKKYKSSTKDIQFELNQINNPLNYWYEILSYHSTRDEATLEESRLHFLYDVKCNPNYYNLSNQTPNGFTTAGKVTAKDEYDNRLFINCDDPRFLAGKLVGLNTGKMPVKDKFGNNFLVSVNDERVEIGELLPRAVGMTAAINKNGDIFYVMCDDPRFLSGDLVGNASGKVVVKDKYGNISQVDINDPLYINGELVPIATGKVHVKDIHGNFLQVDKDDPRYLSGDLIPMSKGKAVVRDNDGNTMQVDKDDPRIATGELVHTATGKVVVKDKYGNISQVDTTDSQYLSGELVPIATGKIMINNGQTNMMIDKNLEIPLGWIVGSLPSKTPKGRSGGNHSHARKISIDDKIYNCVNDAVSELNITRRIIDNRLKSLKTEWCSWKYI